MFWDVIDQSRQAVLKKIVSDPPVSDAYLVGGTGLALLIGHRESIDFDWFSPSSFSVEKLEQDLNARGSLIVTESKSGTFHGILDNVQVTWLRYPYPLLRPLYSVTAVPGLSVASMMDIGVMKIIACSQRGARKDFIDLFAISQEGISVASLITQLKNKFPNEKINYYHIVKSLTFFDDAEREPMPRMLVPINWNDVKLYFLSHQKQFIKSIPS